MKFISEKSDASIFSRNHEISEPNPRFIQSVRIFTQTYFMYDINEGGEKVVE